VPYLASHQGIELLTLAKEFDVSQSQMVADLTTLWMCGLPGYTPLELMELSFESGFVTIHNAETLAHPRTLSDEESIALLLGLDLVIESLPDDRQDLKTIALDLVARLSARSSLPAKLSAIPVIPGSIRSIIEKAVRDKSGVEIVYHSSYSDTITRRTVLPIELRMENGSEYLWGVCQKASALRSFRVDRIQSVAVTTVEKIPTGAVQDNHKIEYTILAHSREREVMERFALKPDALGGAIETSSFSREWIRRSILASSGSVELVAPSDIRSDIHGAAQSLLDHYASQ
jgi:proteasome accessory factor C